MHSVTSRLLSALLTALFALNPILAQTTPQATATPIWSAGKWGGTITLEDGITLPF